MICSTPCTVSGESFTIYTENSLQKPVPAGYPNIIGDSFGAFRQLGLIEGPPVLGNVNTGKVDATGTPNLMANTQMFINTNLGFPATSVGSQGNLSLARRIIIDAPLHGISIDRHSTSWDAIAVPGHTTLSTISFELVGFDCKTINLYGQSWSCSITIFRE